LPAASSSGWPARAELLQQPEAAAFLAAMLLEMIIAGDDPS
jgi:hypothetical protein